MTISNANQTLAAVNRWKYTSTGGETSLSGLDDNGNTLSYQLGTEQIHLNGLLLVRGVDYVATTGSSITGLIALIAGDVIDIVSTVSTVISGMVPLSTVTAKGDLIAATASGAVSNLAVGTNGQFLTAASTASTGLTWSTVSIPSAVSMNEQIFTSSGTWTAPTGVTKAQVLIVSGGGGGSGNGCGYSYGICVGGYGGAQYTAQFTVSPGTAYTVTVGAGGAAGGGKGAAGNSSVFSTKTVAGGLGGDFAPNTGGTNTGQYSLSGQSSYGIGGTAGPNAAAANSGGGGGGYFGGTTGGAGGSGIVIVRWLA